LEGGFERRLLASVRWTLATAVASPQRSESVFPDMPAPKGVGRFCFEETDSKTNIQHTLISAPIHSIMNLPYTRETLYESYRPPRSNRRPVCHGL